MGDSQVNPEKGAGGGGEQSPNIKPSRIKDFGVAKINETQWSAQKLT